MSPVVAITAIPVATAAALASPSLASDALPIVPPAPTPDGALRDIESALRTRIQDVWPPGAGALVAQEFTVTPERVSFRLVALGSGLEPTAVEMLERDLGARLARPVQVTMESVPTDTLSIPAGRGEDWLAAARPRVDAARAVPMLRLCVEVPPRQAREAAIHALVDEWVRTLDADRVQVSGGSEWTLQVRDHPCPASLIP